MKRWWTLALLSGLLGACSARIAESDLVSPHPGPPLDLVAARAALPRLDIDTLALKSADGPPLYAVRLLHPNARATVLYFGGNGYRIADFWRDTLSSYRGTPLNLVLVDHRGFGPSAGTPTIATLLADAVAVYDQVRAAPWAAKLPLIVHGQSLGSFMAGEVARARTLDGLILESSVTTARDWADTVNANSLLLDSVEIDPALAERGNLAVVRALDEPVLFVVGDHDTTTPALLTLRLYEAANLPVGRKQLLVVQGAGHNDAHAGMAFSGTFAQWLAALPARPRP